MKILGILVNWVVVICNYLLDDETTMEGGAMNNTRLRQLVKQLSMAFPRLGMKNWCSELSRYGSHQSTGVLLSCGICEAVYCEGCYRREKIMSYDYRTYGPPGWGVCPNCTAYVELLPNWKGLAYRQVFQKLRREFDDLFNMQTPKEFCDCRAGGLAWFACSCGKSVCGEAMLCSEAHPIGSDHIQTFREGHIRKDWLLHWDRRQARKVERSLVLAK